MVFGTKNGRGFSSYEDPRNRFGVFPFTLQNRLENGHNISIDFYEISYVEFDQYFCIGCKKHIKDIFRMDLSSVPFLRLQESHLL